MNFYAWRCDGVSFSEKKVTEEVGEKKILVKNVFLLLACLVLLLVTFPVLKVRYKPLLRHTIALKAVKRPTMVSAFSDKDSHLGTTTLLVSLLEVIFSLKYVLGLLHPSSGLCSERHLLWRPDILAHLLEVASSCLPLDTFASHNHTAPTWRSVHFATSLRPPNVSPTKAGLCSRLLVTLNPCLVWGWERGPLEETGRG